MKLFNVVACTGIKVEISRTPQPVCVDRRGRGDIMNLERERSVPYMASISVCLPSVFLTYRIDDDFSIFCGENGNQTHEKKIRQYNNPNNYRQKMSATCILQLCF